MELPTRRPSAAPPRRRVARALPRCRSRRCIYFPPDPPWVGGGGVWGPPVWPPTRRHLSGGAQPALLTPPKVRRRVGVALPAHLLDTLPAPPQAPPGGVRRWAASASRDTGGAVHTPRTLPGQRGRVGVARLTHPPFPIPPSSTITTHLLHHAPSLLPSTFRHPPSPPQVCPTILRGPQTTQGTPPHPPQTPGGPPTPSPTPHPLPGASHGQVPPIRVTGRRREVGDLGFCVRPRKTAGVPRPL